MTRVTEFKVFIGGEGPDELGDLSRHASYRSGSPGVLEALLRRVQEDGWAVEGSLLWKQIRKYRAGDHRRPEERNVLGLSLAAREAGCDVVCFTRDRDRDRQREEDLEKGIAAAEEIFGGLRIMGGVATEELESWILALRGERRSEQRADPKAHLSDSHGISTRSRMVAVVNDADLDALPDDARSLRLWLGRAREGLRPRQS